MKVKLNCADKEAREKITTVCQKKQGKTEFETLLCDIVDFADDCEYDEDENKRK